MRNLYSIIFTIYVLTAISCHSLSNKSETKKADSLIIPTDSNTLYLTFPPEWERQKTPNTFFDKKWYDTIQIKGFSYLLFKSKEPILSH